MPAWRHEGIHRCLLCSTHRLLEDAQERLDRPWVADLPKGFGDRAEHLPLVIRLQGSNERPDRPCITHLPQDPGGCPTPRHPYYPPTCLENQLQHFEGLHSPDPHEDLCGLCPHEIVLMVPQHFHQCWDCSSALELAEMFGSLPATTRVC